MINIMKVECDECQGSSEISDFPICSIMVCSRGAWKMIEFSWTDTVDEGKGEGEGEGEGGGRVSSQL